MLSTTKEPIMTPIRLNRSPRPQTLTVGWLAVLLLIGSGCGLSEKTRRDFARTPLGAVGPDEAFAAAQDAMRAEFGQIETTEDTRRIEARPAYFEETMPGGRQVLLRRRGTLELLQRDGRWWAYLQVPIERSETETYRLFESQSRSRDYSVPTPMESGETARPAQKHVWRQIRRDFDRERRVLTALREQLGLAENIPSERPSEAAP